MKNDEIYESQMQVSRSLGEYTAADARLDGPNAWCGNTSLRSPVFQVDLLVETTLTGIVVQGGNSGQSNASIHPTSFLVRMSPVSRHWWTRMVSTLFGLFRYSLSVKCLMSYW